MAPEHSPREATATITWLREFAYGCIYTEDERRLLAIADELEHRRAEVADLRSQLRAAKNGSYQKGE